MSEWMPMEAAPKDIRVLMLLGNNYVTIGKWSDDSYAKKPKPYWSTDWGMVFGKLAERNNQPKAWMPLPEPPK
jgi:hypothetical protein